MNVLRLETEALRQIDIEDLQAVFEDLSRQLERRYSETH